MCVCVSQAPELKDANLPQHQQGSKENAMCVRVYVHPCACMCAHLASQDACFPLIMQQAALIDLSGDNSRAGIQASQDVHMKAACAYEWRRGGGNACLRNMVE